MDLIKNVFLAVLVLAIMPLSIFAEDFTKYNGFNIEKVNINTQRTNPDILRKYFPLKEGHPFNAGQYEKAQNVFHNLRIAKKLDFKVTPSGENNLIVDADVQDGYYIFPLAFATGGSKSAAGLSLAMGNLFKRAENIMLFAGSGDDGTMASAMLIDGGNIFRLTLSNLNFEQRFYEGGWINNDSIFGTSDDEEDFANPLNRIYTKEDSFSLFYSKRFGPLSAFIKPEYSYIRYSKDLDSGNYSNVSFGINYRKNIRGGANMGALFGYGLTDKEKSLRDLPKPIFGYSAQLTYTNGGRWSGADFDISKLSAELQSVIEFKKRHILNIQLKGANTFEAPFAKQIRATELLSGQGKYSRTLYGERGAGLSASFAYYLLRNNTGLLALQPFYELAYVYCGEYEHQSGTGATLSYQFWRFPFPLGINYTYNISDSSKQISFVLGAKF